MELEDQVKTRHYAEKQEIMLFTRLRTVLILDPIFT